MATSQNGWSVIPQADRHIDIDERPINGHRYPNGFRKGDVYKAFVWLFTQLSNRVESVAVGNPPDEWGYNVKKIKGSNTFSNHSSGTAGDYNATEHAQGTRNTYNEKQRDEIHQILDEADGIFRWGGDYTGTPDDMHFEIDKGPAAVAAFIRKIEGEETMDKAERLKLIQELLGTDLGEKGGKDTVAIALQSGLFNGQEALKRLAKVEDTQAKILEAINKLAA